jgi:hypothetical protein
VTATSSCDCRGSDDIPRQDKSHGATDRPNVDAVTGHSSIVTRDSAVERVTGIERA